MGKDGGAFRVWIKTNLLAKMGFSYQSYARRAPKNVDGFDPIDEIVLMAASRMDERHIVPFIFMYELDNQQTTLDKLNNHGFAVKKPGTVQKYLREAKTRVIELVLTEKDLMQRLKDAINGGGGTNG